MSADLKFLLITGLAGIHLPRGSIWGGRVATDRQSYGFQVFEDVAVGKALPNPDAALLPDGSFCSLTSTKDWRAKLLNDLLSTIYPEQEVEINQAPVRYTPETVVWNFPPDFTKWDSSDGNYPDAVDPEDRCLVILRNGELREGEAGDFNWGQDEWDTVNEIVAYKPMRVQPAVHVVKKKAEIPADFTLWNGVGFPENLQSDDRVSVIYFDGLEDSGLVGDFIWNTFQTFCGPPSQIKAYRVDSTMLQVPEIQELHPEPEAEFVPSPAVDGVRTFHGTTADPEINRFLPVEDVWALETDLTSGPGAFMYRDGHIVAVANTLEFHRSHMKEVSTFRAAKDHEAIIGYKVFDEDAVFWEGKDVNGPGLDPLKAVTAYFAVSPKVTRDSFTLDWSAVGDPWNDIVAYKVWK